MIKIIDDFISKYDFNILKSSIENIPWFFSSISNGDEEDDILCDELDNFHFTHLFYKDYQITSDKTELIVPIIQKLNIRALIKIKANLTTRTPTIVKHCLHRDLDYNDSYTAVYYVNSNDGYTLFEDKTKVESIENRIVIFPTNMKHTGTTCTNQKNRIVINFNYF